MAYDAVRAQLDKLLGPDRNGPIHPSKAKKTPHYTDDSVCKFYLLGFCPHDLHIKHRSEPGSCPNLHSDAAKAAFEQDDAAGKVRRERARWVRELLRECRAILYDEDRKIRGHARRLQETYGATGDLAGLMIRNFDTLKKLGMVSKDAKIRVLSEMEDMDGVDEQEDQFSNPNQVPVPDAPSQPGQSYSSNKDDTEATGKLDKKSSPCNGKVDKNGDGDDDDDLDGFGIVKVIPASGSPSATAKRPKDGDSKKIKPEEEVDEFGRIKVKKPQDKKNDTARENSLTKVREGKTIASGVEDDDDDDDFGVINIIPPSNKNRDDSSDEEDESKPSQLTPEKQRLHGSPESKSKSKNGQHPSETAKKNDSNQLAKQGKGQASSVRDTTVKPLADSGPENNNDTKTQAEDGKGDSNSLSPEQIMDKFYEAGKGPDGLLMLDRKQSLRVCQCCGGYISLVDAESRLLSHYGGKSHHSLAQLRSKVPELEEYLSTIPSHLKNDESSRPGPRSHWSERERDRPPRRDGDRYSNSGNGGGNGGVGGYGVGGGAGYLDRHAGRSRPDTDDGRGYGTTTWYSGTERSDEKHREYGRRNQDDVYRGDEQRRRSDDYRTDGRNHDGVERQRQEDRHRNDRYRDARHRDDRFSGGGGSDERNRREDRYGRDNRYYDKRNGGQRHQYDDRSRDRDGMRYDSGRKRQRSPSPQRSNRRSRRQY